MTPRALAVLMSFTCAVAACSGDTENSSSDAAAGSAGIPASGGSSASGGSGANGGRGGSGGSAAATGGAGSAGAGAGGNAGSAGAGALGGSSGNGGTGSAGRDGGQPDAPTSCPEGGTPDASTEDAIRASCSVAVVRVSRLDEECSGLGGTHVTLTVLVVGRGRSITTLSHGGHGYFAGPDGPRAVGEYFVAGVDAFGGFEVRPANGAWCIPELPNIDGYAHTLLRASSEADARTKMRDLVGTLP